MKQVMLFWIVTQAALSGCAPDAGFDPTDSSAAQADKELGTYKLRATHNSTDLEANVRFPHHVSGKYIEFRFQDYKFTGHHGTPDYDDEYKLLDAIAPTLSASGPGIERKIAPLHSAWPYWTSPWTRVIYVPLPDVWPASPSNKNENVVQFGKLRDHIRVQVTGASAATDERHEIVIEGMKLDSTPPALLSVQQQPVRNQAAPIQLPHGRDQIVFVVANDEPTIRASARASISEDSTKRKKKQETRVAANLNGVEAIGDAECTLMEHTQYRFQCTLDVTNQRWPSQAPIEVRIFDNAGNFTKFTFERS
jgi:hypothetical protein